MSGEEEEPVDAADAAEAGAPDPLQVADIRITQVWSINIMKHPWQPDTQTISGHTFFRLSKQDRRLCQWVPPPISDELRLAMNSYYGCCQVLDSLKHAATGSISGAELKPQVESYLRAFKATRQEMLQSFYFCLMLFFWSYIYIYIDSD